MFLLNDAVYAQSCPPNIDFELGNFSGWDCFTGTTSVTNGKNVISLLPSPPMAGIHEIVRETFPAVMDKYGKFPVHCPYGGKYSVKLGNDGTGSQAEGLSYTFQVPLGIDTFSFTYFYAVVFQDPNHNRYEQPRFFVTAYDVVSGALINCASYDYVATGSIPGFRISAIQPDVLYKSWSPVSIQFAGLAGRKIRLEFKTADCTLGGHFGYAYVDVGAGCSNILATAPYCVETNSLLLNAPYGFQYYTWYNSDYSAIVGNQQSLTISPPPATSGVFHVDIIPYPGYGCRDTADAVIHPLPVPDIPMADSVYSYCQFARASPLVATALVGNDLLWYPTAAGGTGDVNAPSPSTATPGVFYYFVTQKILFGCESHRKKITVTINPTPLTSFVITNNIQCLKGNKFEYKSTSVNLQNSNFTWDFGDGQSQLLGDTTATHTYTAYGVFYVKLKVTNQPSCTDEKILTVTVAANPVASFTYPSLICENQTAVALKDNSNVPGGLAAVNNWLWNINGSKSIKQNPDSITIKSGGSFPAQLVVSSTAGCSSDTVSRNINVRYQPLVKFTYSKPLCDNEIVRFTDISSMPANASPEYVARWHWRFSNSDSTLLQHPTRLLSKGTTHTRLIVESNYGCKSVEADSVFIIHPKPLINLFINDSCILRTIKYQASDSRNTVNKWYWDFGNGLKISSPLIIKTYNQEGNRPVTLLGQTIYGCQDTVVRPFIIYDNKALAGRDTIAAKGEPIYLNAHGGANVIYNWSPVIGLNDASIENPVATYDKDQLYRLDAMTDKGCDSHSKLFIKRYTGPELYIPNAFSPNGDGSNDVLKVFPVGIKQFIFFAVYNRYGQEVYRTSDYTKGWDGIFKGSQMNAGTYVAVSKAIDYTGKLMLEKTTVMLVR